MKNKKHFKVLALAFGFIIIFLNQLNGQDFDNTRPKNNNLTGFRRFISKFKLLPCPFTANTTCYYPDGTLSVSLDMDNDSIFVNYTGPAVSIGMLPDTSRFYAVIYCIAAACYMPTLAVYSKEGTLISRREISKGCGSGVGYACSENLHVNSIKDISVVRIEEQYNLDGLGKEVKGSRRKTIVKNKYFIDRKGTIGHASL